MAAVSIDGDQLVVRLSGWESVWALRRKIVVPLRSVLGASAGTVHSKLPRGIRLPGTFVPKLITAGSYWRKSEGWSFWSVRDERKAIDIRLRDTRFVRIVVQVDDPYATVAMIEAATRGL
ncbi:MAG TPA: hypothetical protein VFV93_12980 [Thermomicrobiales bacterium]|nr:hypothetical protein [Thermomicrobiales bacterium]